MISFQLISNYIYHAHDNRLNRNTSNALLNFFLFLSGPKTHPGGFEKVQDSVLFQMDSNNLIGIRMHVIIPKILIHHF